MGGSVTVIRVENGIVEPCSNSARVLSFHFPMNSLEKGDNLFSFCKYELNNNLEWDI